MKQILLALLIILGVPCVQAQGHLFHIPNGMHAGPVGPFVGIISVKPALATCIPGTCSDNFAGPAGQPLAAHNPAWISRSSDAPVGNFALNGSGIVEATTAWRNAGALFSTSTSDTASATFKPSDGQDKRRICVRASADTSDGYCVGLAYNGGTDHPNSYGRTTIDKNGTELCESDTSELGKWAWGDDHRLKVSVTEDAGVVTIIGYTDGVQEVTCTDSTSILPVGNPAVLMQVSGTPSQDAFSLFQDF